MPPPRRRPSRFSSHDDDYQATVRKSLQTAAAENDARNDAMTVLATVTATTVREAAAQHVFTQEIRYTGALTREEFDYATRSDETISRIQMADDGMCGIRALTTHLELDINKLDITDVLSQLRTILRQLSLDQQEYVHQVNELWTPGTPFTEHGGDRHVAFLQNRV